VADYTSMWLLTSAVIVEGYRFCRVDYGSEFSSFSHYSVDALIALLVACPLICTSEELV